MSEVKPAQTLGHDSDGKRYVKSKQQSLACCFPYRTRIKFYTVIQ